MAQLELDPMKWAGQQFGTCELGTRRAVHCAAQIAADPDASTPLQTETWSELKAAYRLIDQENVTSLRSLADIGSGLASAPAARI